MRIIFMGTPDFAVPSLQKLCEVHEVAAVITAPDKRAGRGKKPRASAVKIAALALGIEVLQPTNLKDSEFVKSLENLAADLYVVVAFRMLPDVVWQMPPKGTVNLHASLLPRYRGAAPINRAIMNGERITGLTTFFIQKAIDTGAILDQIEIPIGPNDTAGELHDQMKERGAGLLASTVAAIEEGTATATPQLIHGNEEIPAAPKIFKTDRRINWGKSAQTIHNHVRGLSPYPAATSPATDGKEYKILRTLLDEGFEESERSPGETRFQNDRLFAKTGHGSLEILELQAPGKKPMKGTDFFRGYRQVEPLRFL